MNNRVYAKSIFEREIESYKEQHTQLYCEDCFEPWDKGDTNISRIDRPCDNCGSLHAAGVPLKRLREIKLKNILNG